MPARKKSPTRQARSRKKGSAGKGPGSRKKGSGRARSPARRKAAARKKAPFKKKTAARKKTASRKKAATRKKTTRRRKTAPRKKAVSRPRKTAGRTKTGRRKTVGGSRPGTPGAGAVAARVREPEEEKAAPASARVRAMVRLYEEALSALHENAYAKARDHFKQLTDKFPEEIELGARARAFIRVCNRHLKKTRKKRPATAEEVFNQAVLYHNARRFEDALEALSRALKLSRKRKDHIHYAMAAAEVCMGNTDEGLKHLKQAIEMNQDNRFFASNDPDFEPLANNQTFHDLIYPQ